MAYLDDMAAEREKTRAKMLEGKTPLLGEDTSRALHALGVSLGVVPAGAGPGQFEQLLASLVGPVKGVKVDDYKSPQYNPQSGTRASGGGGGGGYSGGGGDGLSGLADMMSKAKDSALQKLLEEKRKIEQSKPGSGGGGGASVRDRSVSGAAARAQRHRDNTPGPYAKGDAATQWAREQIPGLKPDDSSGGVTSTANAYMTEKTPGPGVRGVERGTATGDRILPGADLKGVDPRIAEIVGAAAEGLPPEYKVRPTSGVRATGHGQHTKAAAADWEIVKSDGKGGWEAVPNRGEDTKGLYTKLAKNAYGYQEKNHPDLTGKFQWGGQFGTSAAHPDEPDLMHFDIGGRRGRITRYSRESIGAELPPAAKGAAAAPPAWDKGLPKGADPKTAWADPNKTTLPGSDRLELPSTTTAATPAASHGAGLSPELIKHVKYWEARGGFDAKAYPDGKQWSIGYGTKANSPNEVIDQAEADRRLISELTKAQGEVDKILPANTPANVRDALTSLTMNVGPGWTTEEGGRLRAAVTSGNWRNAAEVIKEYNHADGKEVKGLTVRRSDESRMILGSPSSAPAQAAAPTSPPRDPTQALYGDTVRGYQAANGQPPASAPQAHPQNPQTAQIHPANQPPPPQTPAPAPTQRAPAPPPPSAPATPAPQPQPPAAPKGPTGVQKANAFLDMKAMDLIRRDSPENDTFVTRNYVGDRTVRQMMSDPMASGKMKENLPLAAKKYGFTPQDFDAAMHGKRAEGGPAQTSDQLLAQAQGAQGAVAGEGGTQLAGAKDYKGIEDTGNDVIGGKHLDQKPVVPGPYAQADTGTMTDAGPGKAAGSENQSAASQAMQLNPQEQALYQRHLENLKGPGGVDNQDGSRSTLYASTFEVNGRTYVIPTVRDGKILPADEAFARAKTEGLDKFPSYASEDEANKRYQQMHDYMEKDTSSYLQNRGSAPPPDSGSQPAKAPDSGTLGYQRREQLFPGEDKYFKANPNVAGMAAETGDIILNPYSPPDVNKDAVARNEAMRLYMRDKGVTPDFAITPEQRAQFKGTAYGNDDAALKQTIAARIYSGDPSAHATDEQRHYVESLKPGAGKDRPARELEPEATVATPEQAARDKAWQDKWATMPTWQDGKPPPAGKNDDPNRPVTPAELEQLKALKEIQDASPTELFPGAPARPQGLTDFERATGATLPPSEGPMRRTEFRTTELPPRTAPATAKYGPYSDFRSSENIEDRRGEVGGARHAMGIRAGIGREPATVAPWVNPDPGKDNPMSRALGIDIINDREKAAAAAYMERVRQNMDRQLRLEEEARRRSQPDPERSEKDAARAEERGQDSPLSREDLGKILDKRANSGIDDSPAPSQLSQFAGTARAQSPSLTPEMIKALQSVFKDAGVPEKGTTPPPPDAQPVLPSQVAPMPQAPPGGGGGGLSLAPSGLNTGPVESPGAPTSQGGNIAMAGLLPLPPIQDTASTLPSSNLSPIPWDIVNDWGGGGGFGAFG